ncbi:manganese catalase family protein [Geodermatophilus sp. YIM 151500]|uniref:manganese catalase family protein n=1 Tax=Geodermatophilus sp. YIM 151500 TaxID=2984531 RepID=UPI0021E3E803|nr:manganese catalase family protein [Geodermatophilus sp. YIM 151500]MCV2490539.1 manganese catalase family protein [Geodermatophilus sp. YIM 151500]
MFTHTQALQFEAKPDGPDPAFARRMQEILGGQWGEMTVATQYLLQGWNCRLPGKYKDMLLAIGTEELAHVEMIVTMIDRLLDHQPLKPDASDRSKEAAAGFGQVNPQHAIANGGGAYYKDSMGVPWSGGYVTASGNLMADFHYNATAEMQGRLQVSRLYNMTDDPGVKEMLRFLITRDHMHQNQWLAAIEELKSDGLEGIPVPEAFPLDEEQSEYSYAFIQASDGAEAAAGRWASGPAPDGRGQFTARAIEATADAPVLPPGDPRLFGTPQTEAHGLLQKAKDMLT